MKIRKVRTVFLKELIDVTRDRRTLISMVLLPIILIPGIMILVGLFIAKNVEREKQQISKVVIVGQERDHEIVRRLEEDENFQIANVEFPKQALKNKQINVILELPAEFQDSIENESGVKLIILYDSSQDKSRQARRRLRELLSEYKDDIVKSRFAKREINLTMIEPFDIIAEDQASEEQRGGRFLAAILPAILVMMAMTGGMYPAIDLTAGEKERGTLETILVSSATRLELVIGKFLVVFVAGLTAGLLNLTSMTLTFGFGFFMASEMADVKISIDPAAILVMILLLLPLICFFACLLIIICSLAKSYKEAQSYVTPLSFAMIVPAYLVIFVPTLELNAKMAWIPVVNVMLAIKEILVGTYSWNYIGMIFLATTILAAVMLIATSKFYQREEVLFRT